MGFSRSKSLVALKMCGNCVYNTIEFLSGDRKLAIEISENGIAKGSILAKTLLDSTNFHYGLDSPKLFIGNNDKLASTRFSTRNKIRILLLLAFLGMLENIRTASLLQTDDELREKIIQMMDMFHEQKQINRAGQYALLF